MEDNEDADNYELIISASKSSLPKVARVMQEMIKTKDGSISLEDAYRTLYNGCIMSGLEKDDAFNRKDRLEKAGAIVSLKGFKYYSCDKCGATYREEAKPKRCNRCRTQHVTFTRVMREDVLFCPKCHYSWKINYEDGLYRCAECGMYSTIAEINEYNNKL